MQYDIKKEGKYNFIEEGQGETLLLLHGLFGALSNFAHLLEKFQKNYKVVIPMLPIFELPIYDTTVSGLVKFVHKFVELKGYTNINLLGNSLGGHIALLYALDSPERIKTITLTGSSGLFESGLGGTFPKRGDYDYIKERVGYTFFDPNVATKELVDEVFEITNNRNKVIRVISMAKSAMRNNLAGELSKINTSTLLIWGKEDKITPPYVGEEFNKLIKNSELKFVNQCGHAPMMERPGDFNALLEEFLIKHKS